VALVRYEKRAGRTVCPNGFRVSAIRAVVGVDSVGELGTEGVAKSKGVRCWAGQSPEGKTGM